MKFHSNLIISSSFSQTHSLHPLTRLHYFFLTREKGENKRKRRKRKEKEKRKRREREHNLSDSPTSNIPFPSLVLSPDSQMPEVFLLCLGTGRRKDRANLVLVLEGEKEREERKRSMSGNRKTRKELFLSRSTLARWRGNSSMEEIQVWRKSKN